MTFPVKSNHCCAFALAQVGRDCVVARAGVSWFPRLRTVLTRCVSLKTIVGVWTIKLNYLFFFRRLTRQIRFYIILWRIVLCIVLASGAVNLGLIPYQCTFGSFTYVATTCATDAEIQTAVAVNKAGVGLNVSTDIMRTCPTPAARADLGMLCSCAFTKNTWTFWERC